MRRFHIIACHVLWREFCQFAALSENVFTFDFLKQGLHNEPDKLRLAVQKAIDAAEVSAETEPANARYETISRKEPPEAILLGYGLCSNGIRGIRSRTIPLVVPRAHDCITFLLGSKERYRECFDQHPGTYWYSPGWIDTHTQPGPERFDTLRKAFVEKYGDDNAEYLMEVELGWVKKYTSATYVDLGCGQREKYIQYTRDCAAYCQWKCDIQQGDSTLVRNLLDGAWNERDFLVVQPGQMIVPSDDERIVMTAPAQ